jgi:hypothetical protein
LEHGHDIRKRVWQGFADMKDSDDYVLHVYMKQRKQLPNVQRGSSGGPAVDSHGRLVGILVGALSKHIPIEDLLNAKRRSKLERNMSKAYGRMVLKTKFVCKRCEVSPVLPVLGELRSAIRAHIKALDFQRAEEERLSRL